ncbi:MAG: carboxypeptidase-like regulatory domain-containing protein, partial [Bacteroidota bacterium]
MLLTRYKYSVVLPLFFHTVVVSQTCHLSGFVSGENGKPVPGAHVVLKHHNLIKVTDNKGYFEFLNLSEGNYHITISAIGFDDFNKKILLETNKKRELVVALEPGTEKLDEIVISGSSKATVVNESGYAAKGIALNKLQSSSFEADKLLSRSSGVKIRQSGGIGSSMDISINGLSGKMVKYFYDGIPINADYLSPLHTVPFNTLDYIEVYKGVIPSHLISDALGGAINMISYPPQKNYTDINLETGSYGLSRSFAGLQRQFSNGFFTGGYISYLKSNNNYPVNIEVSDPVTGRVKTDEVERFHDKFSVISGKAKIGWQNKKRNNLIYTSFQLNMTDKEIQHGILMENPAGEAFVHANTFQNRIVYQKDSLLSGRLVLDITNYFMINEIQYTDTTRNIYNWYGEISGQRLTGNEIYHYDVPHNSLVKPINNHFKIAGKYFFNKGFVFHPTLMYSFYQRTGSDLPAAAANGTDPYS